MLPLLQWTSNEYYVSWVFVCSLRYPTCNALASHCHLRPSTLYNTFPLYLINGTMLKTNTEHQICVLVFSTTFVWYISHSKKKWARYDWKMCTGLQVKYPLFLAEFNNTLIFSTDFRKIVKCQISNFMKIRPVGAELFRWGGRKDGQTWRS